MNALERTSVERRRELPSKETRGDSRGGRSIQERDREERRKTDATLDVRMLSHTANVKVQNDGGRGGRGVIGVGDGVDGA